LHAPREEYSDTRHSFTWAPCSAHGPLFDYACAGFDINVLRAHGRRTVVLTSRRSCQPVDISNIDEWIYLDLLYSNSCPEGTARIVNSTCMDERLPRIWKSKCDELHSHYCGKKLSSSNPHRLIDVQNNCVVPGYGKDSYVALSYVWGRAKFFTAHTNIVELLQRPGILPTLPIPKTIKDAIKVTELLGERYLWVDSLCILQDDMINKHLEIRNMCSIFGNASVTIIAAEGKDADSGLFGLPGVSSPRSYPFHQEIHRFKELEIVRKKQVRCFDAPPWDKRGWIFQEEKFSRRNFIFRAQSLYWECCRAHWCEDTVPLLDRIGSGKLSELSFQDVISALYPNHYEFWRLVDQYNTRKLTYSEDALHAFAGVTTALSSSFKQGFIGGLPVVCFSAALLWRACNSAKRQVSQGTHSWKTCLPSWSWARWRCLPVTDEGGNTLYSADSYCKQDGSGRLRSRAVDADERVIPTLQWFSHSSPEDHGVPIPEKLFSYRDRYLHSSMEEPPHGWSRHPISKSKVESHFDRMPPDWRDCISFYIYRHHLDPKAEFWHPIPLPKSGEPVFDNTASFLSCRSRRAWLLGGHPIKDSFQRTRIPLRNDIRVMVGTMSVNSSCNESFDSDSDSDHEGPLESKYAVVPCELLELVEIAHGYYYYDKYKTVPWGKLPPRQHTTEEAQYELGIGEATKCEIYHVMWIEWKNNIAYRKGVGQVYKEDWEAQELEWIHLMLG
jgi:Heterokaryon incompatibility protein (HET)